MPEPFQDLEKLNSFIGRDDELKNLEDCLINKQSRGGRNVVCITGVPGVGKSALACYFAFEYRKYFLDGVYGFRVDSEIEDLRPIVKHFANACGEPINEGDERNENTIMQELFKEKQVLLLMDNVKNVNIQGLLPDLPNCAIIITTQNADILGASISSDRQISLKSLPENKSLDLLKKLVGEERITAEYHTAQHISKMVGHLPLALQVIGAALRTGFWGYDSLKNYAVALEEKRLDLLSRGNNENLNVKASFALSIERLDKQKQGIYACLGVIPTSSFSLKTLMAVGNCSQSDASDTLHTLINPAIIEIAFCDLHKR